MHTPIPTTRAKQAVAEVTALFATAVLALTAAGCTRDLPAGAPGRPHARGMSLAGVASAAEVVDRLAEYDGPYRLESTGDPDASAEGPEDFLTLGARAPQLGTEQRDAAGRVRSTTTGPHGRTVVFGGDRCWSTHEPRPELAGDGVWHLRRLQTTEQGSGHQHWAMMQSWYSLLPDPGQAYPGGELEDSLAVRGDTLTVTRTRLDSGEVDTVEFHLDAHGVPTKVVSTRHGFGPVTTTLAWDVDEVRFPTGGVLGADTELCRTNVPDVTSLTSEDAARELAGLLVLAGSSGAGLEAPPFDPRQYLARAVESFPAVTVTASSDFAASGRVTVDADGSPVCLVVPALSTGRPSVTDGACR